ncbi:YHYH protein [Celeribacter halophilus]|uniref:YHYH protein n=1 Tax=Celeribacter halophilus TaxID=576117 RepID=UPI003A8C8F76
MAMFEQSNPTAPSPVIGFTADGFPIYGSYIDDNGTIRPARSSYRLKAGTLGFIEYNGSQIRAFAYPKSFGNFDLIETV